MLGTVLEASSFPTKWSITLECRRRKMLGTLVDTIGSYQAVRRSRPAEGQRRGKGWGGRVIEKDTERSTDCPEQDKTKTGKVVAEQGKVHFHLGWWETPW